MKQLVNFFGRKAKSQVMEDLRKPSRRQLRSESLEQRQLLAGDLLVAHNYSVPEDVNGDWRITPLDALLVLNHIARQNGSSSLDGYDREENGLFVDVSGDNLVTPLDALRVLNRISRGEGVGELLELSINPRTRDDEAFSASAFNASTRQLTVGVNEIFNLELLYSDLRGVFDRVGAFAIYADILFDTAGILEPVLTETQTLSLSANVRNADGGNLRFSFTGSPENFVTVPFEVFAASPEAPAREIRNAIEALGYRDVVVRSLPGDNTDPLTFQIRYNDFDLDRLNIPNLVVDLNLINVSGNPLNATATVTDDPPLIPDPNDPDVMIINPNAIPLNFNFLSRTFRATAENPRGEPFYGGLLQVGTFDPNQGFIDAGATGPIFINGFPDANAGPLPRPFDVFSIPVRLTQPVEDFRIFLDPPNTSGTTNLFYGNPSEIPNELIRIRLDVDPTDPTDGTGVLFVTAVGDSVVTVNAANDSMGAVQNGPVSTINLADLVTVTNGDGSPITYSIVSQPGFGTVEVNPTTGVASYTPSATQSGTTTFVYSATVDGVTDTGTITVNVTALPVTVEAGDSPLNAQQGGPAVTLELNDLVTVTNGDGLARTFTLTTPPTIGSANINATTGRLTYTPPAGSSGQTTLVYTVTVNGVSDTGTITINVAPETVVLTANPGTLTAFQNGLPVTINLNNLISVTPAGTQVTFELIPPNPTLGTAVLGAGGIVTYTPPANQSGADSFRYRVTSVGSDVQVAEATVTVTVNQEITINADDAQRNATQGGPAVVINPFPGTLVQTTGTTTNPTITLNTTGTQGSVTLVGGVLTYTPPNTRFGTDTFRYTASLPAIPGFAGASDEGVITITEVASITAAPRSITALPGNPAQVINLLTGVTVTGTDDAPTFTINTAGLVGTAVLNGTNVTYTPPATPFGTTSFTYTATVAGVSATAAVTISEGVLIQTSPGSLTAVPGGQPVTLALSNLTTVTGNQGAPVYSLATNPTIGTATVNPSTGLLTYTPPATGSIGQITFDYRVTADGVSQTNTITVTELTVVAPDRTLTVNEAQPNVPPQGTTLQLSATVSVALPPTFTIVTPPTLGTASIAGNVLTYTPRAFDFDQTVFTDTIVYRATVNGVSDTGTIAVTINPTVLPPVAVADSVTAVANTSTRYTSAQLTRNDTPIRPNPSGQPPLVTAAAAIPGVTAGTVAFNPADNSVTFTPDADFIGETSFSYTMTSGGQTSTATVTVNVRQFVPSIVAGTVFTDYIESVSRPVRNGVRDSNEPVMGGVGVRLTSPPSQNLFGQQINQLVLTDSDGRYVFGDVPPGTYEVTFEVPDSLIFGAAVNSSSLPATSSGRAFTVVVGEDGGMTYSGLDFTVWGRTGLAAGTGTLLVSQYLLSAPNSPYNSSRPDFGLATMIVNPTSGDQQVFELTQGFEGVVFAEIAVGRSGATALLTLIMEDGTVKTALLSKDDGDFVVSSSRAVVQVFRNVNSMNFITTAEDALEREYGRYRDAVDQVLAAGLF